jgi:CelD/BcsL family acetyltransferase involved in cellulose biosynthesis
MVSLPFGYAAGPIALNSRVAEQLAHEALDLARRRGTGRVEIKQVAPPGEPSPGFTRVTHYAAYRVPTEGGESAIWRRLHASSTQRSIRKGEKSGVQVTTGESESDWRAMAELEERTAHGHGVPAPPRRFFLSHCRELQRAGLAELYLARVPDRGVAAGIVVWKGWREWIYAFGASRPELLEYRPNHVLIWRALREAAEAGVTFDLGRAAPEQEGLVEFKRRWGGEPVPLAYDYWPNAAGLNVARRDTGPLALAARVWSRLPASIARRGSVLYRYLG